MMRVDSKAAAKRIPIGTRLYLVNSLMGPCRQYKELVKVQSGGLVFRNLEGQKAGTRSYLSLGAGEWVQATERGFRLMLKDDRTNEARICAEYEFADEGREAQIARQTI